MSARKPKMTAAEIRAALTRRYPQPESAIVFEVAQATGFDARRHLDAVAMELWPSRGLTLHGIEIKISRHDWLREKAQPEKAEEIARYCDFFSIAAPAGLIPSDELPSAWGLLEVSGTEISVRRDAARTAAQAVDRPFLAALLRAASRGIDPASMEALLERRRAAQDEDFQNKVQAEARRIAERQKTGAASWQKLCDTLGHDPDKWLRDAEVIEAVRLVLASGAARTWSNLRGLHDMARKAQQEIEQGFRELGVEITEPPRPKRRRSR